MNQVHGIVWTALAVAQVIYFLIPVPARPNAASPSATFALVYPLALGAVAGIQALIIVSLLQLRAFKPIQAGQLDPMSTPGASQLFTTLLIAWVLAESVAIYGLVLRFMLFPRSHSLPFFLAGAVLLFLGRPWNPKLKKPLSLADLARSSAPLN